MSIQTQIDRIAKNVQDSLAVLASAGVEVPDGANSDNLPELIALLIPTGPDVATMAISYSGDMIDAGVVTMADGEYRLLTLTSSGTLTLEEEVEAEVWMCGGGVDGGDPTTSGDYGGAGAYTASGTMTLGKSTVAVVGAGNNGLSSFRTLQTAACSGQNGGTGGGGTTTSAAGTGDGVDKHPFGDSTYFPDAHCAGGAAGGTMVADVGVGRYGGDGGTNGSDGEKGGTSSDGTAPGGTGGQVGGGAGGKGDLTNPHGSAATFYGSGGGGGGTFASGMIGYSYGTPGAGYQGVIYVRIPVNQAA